MVMQKYTGVHSWFQVQLYVIDSYTITNYLVVSLMQGQDPFKYFNFQKWLYLAQLLYINEYNIDNKLLHTENEENIACLCNYVQGIMMKV